MDIRQHPGWGHEHSAGIQRAEPPHPGATVPGQGTRRASIKKCYSVSQIILIWHYFQFSETGWKETGGSLYYISWVQMVSVQLISDIKCCSQTLVWLKWQGWAWICFESIMLSLYERMIPETRALACTFPAQTDLNFYHSQSQPCDS